MNPREAHDKLIDLVYDELPPRQRDAVLRAADADPLLADELARLRAARAALAGQRAAAPPMDPLLPTTPHAEPTPAKALPFPWPRAAAGLAAAAAALIAVGLWLLQNTTPPAVAALGPVEIERTDVSLTILSTPPDWPGGPTPLGADYGPVQTLATTGLAPSRGWRGLALVRDAGIIRKLQKGRTEVRFADVPAGIVPETVRLTGLDAPDALAILEQNYQFDLATADSILRKYIDRTITVVFHRGAPVTGTLLSHDPSALVIRPQGHGPRTIPRDQVAAVVFPDLPEGLLSRPTLVWSLQNQGPPAQRFEVAYMASGLTWRADYILKLRPAPGDGPRTREGRLIDTADVVGYATVNNQSGASYRNAQLKLMAGDVNLIKPRNQWHMDRIEENKAHLGAAGREAGFAEKSFFEYHLYTLGRPTDIDDRETKQIELVSGAGVKLVRHYVYDPDADTTAPRVVSVLENKEQNGLGKPLPKGVVRLYAPGPDGLDAYVARARIDHTPVKEEVRLPWGFAFDIACTHKLADRRVSNTNHQVTRTFQLRNHKPTAEVVTLVVRVPASTSRAVCTRGGEGHPWRIEQVGLIEVDVTLPADHAETITFEYEYDTAHGGGLRAPTEAQLKQRALQRVKELEKLRRE